jgi:7-cyano-7-deazaguanine synthase
MRSAVLFSGGIDSTATAILAEDNPILLFIDYGQRNKMREWEATLRIARHLQVYHEVIDIALGMQDIMGHHELQTNPMFNRSLEFNPNQVPVIPGRNLLLASIGAAWCAANSIDRLLMGLHYTTSQVPDSHTDFYEALKQAVKVYGVELVCPLIRKDKGDIIRIVAGQQMLDMTWSCYDDLDKPCCKCAACKARGHGI